MRRRSAARPSSSSAREILAVDQHLPGGGHVEAGEQSEQRGLARARGADDRDGLARLRSRSSRRREWSDVLGPVATCLPSATAFTIGCMFDLPIRLLAAHLLLVLLTAASWAQPPAILVFGDSLSAGYGLPQGKGWVDLLRQRLQAQRAPPTQVVNASISGETTLGGRNRLAGVLAAHRPQIVILELGANDALRGQSLATMRDNLIRMVRDCQAAKARVLLVGMRIPPNYGPDYTKKFQASLCGGRATDQGCARAVSDGGLRRTARHVSVRWRASGRRTRRRRCSTTCGRSAGCWGMRVVVINSRTANIRISEHRDHRGIQRGTEKTRCQLRTT